MCKQCPYEFDNKVGEGNDVNLEGLCCHPDYPSGIVENRFEIPDFCPLGDAQ